MVLIVELINMDNAPRRFNNTDGAPKTTDLCLLNTDGAPQSNEENISCF
jgi:hypothetical protein